MRASPGIRTQTFPVRSRSRYPVAPATPCAPPRYRTPFPRVKAECITLMLAGRYAIRLPDFRLPMVLSFPEVGRAGIEPAADSRGISSPLSPLSYRPAVARARFERAASRLWAGRSCHLSYLAVGNRGVEPRNYRCIRTAPSPAGSLPLGKVEVSIFDGLWPPTGVQSPLPRRRRTFRSGRRRP